MKAKHHPSSSVLALATLVAASAITSCSLPPREAWRQIRQEGLIAFLATESPAPGSVQATAPQTVPTPAPVATPLPQPVMATSTPASSNPKYAGPPAPVSAKNSTAVVNPAPASKNLMPAGEKALVAASVPSLPGFVRSPYTIPPRLVDVKGATPGATMVCPYTQRPFIVPQDFVNPPGSALASNTPPTTTPVTPAPQPKASAEVAKNNNAAPTAPAPATNPPANALFSNTKPSGNTASPGNGNAAPKPVAPEIPYGSPIPGRPGFVNSPFAAKHQLVDVTGLPVGMEVKCPYTGKLFKVPAQDIAEQKAVAAPGAPPAPEKPEKK